MEAAPEVTETGSHYSDYLRTSCLLLTARVACRFWPHFASLKAAVAVLLELVEEVEVEADPGSFSLRNAVVEVAVELVEGLNGLFYSCCSF